MTLNLLAELCEMRLHDVKVSEGRWRREALEFQQLMLDNPWVHDLDVELENVSDGEDKDVLVHVKHPEFIDLTFHVAEGFRIDTPEDSEQYGSTGREAYESAMPIIIGMKAGFELKEKSTLFNDFTLDIDDGPGWTSTIQFNHHSRGRGNDANIDAHFKWNVQEQGFEPVDEDNLPGGSDEICKTIAEMNDYLDSWSS